MGKTSSNSGRDTELLMMRAKTHLVFRFSLLLSTPWNVSASMRRDQFAWKHSALVLRPDDVEGLSGAVLAANDGARRHLSAGRVYP